MASSKIIATSPPYSCVELSWNRKKAKRVFTDLKEIAQNYKYGVDELGEFYFEPISNTIMKRFWIGKGVKLFEPDEEVDPIINEYDVLVGQMASGDNYLLTVKDDGVGSSQEKFGIRKDNLLLNEAVLSFGSDLASGKTPTTNPVAGTPANMTDGNAGTEWDSGTNQLTSHYIEVDLGTVKSYIGKVRIDSSNITDKDTCFADRYKIMISTTGAFAGEETTVFSSEVDFGTADAILTFVPTSGRYVRIQITQVKAAHWHVDLLEIYEWNVADITRWATEILNQTKDEVKRGVLELEECYEKLWPEGKIRVTSRDGTSYHDYAHVATSVHVGTARKIAIKLALGKVERSVADQILAQKRMISEYGIAGLSRDADLSSGAGLQGGKIIHTHVGKNTIESPMVRALAIITDHLAALSVVASKINVPGLDGSGDIVIEDGVVTAPKLAITDLANIANLLTVAGYIKIGATVLPGDKPGIAITDGTHNRFEAGQINSDFGVNLRDANGVVNVSLGNLQRILEKVYDEYLTQDATSVTITGLNGDVDLFYFIHVVFINQSTQAGGYNFWMRCGTSGGIDAGNNYGRKYVLVDGGDNVTGGAFAAIDHWYMGDGDTINHVCSTYQHMEAKSGKERTTVGTSGIDAAGSAVTQMGTLSQAWSNTAGNITQIQIGAGKALGMKAGTHISIYKIPVWA